MSSKKAPSRWSLSISSLSGFSINYGKKRRREHQLSLLISLTQSLCETAHPSNGISPPTKVTSLRKMHISSNLRRLQTVFFKKYLIEHKRCPQHPPTLTRSHIISGVVENKLRWASDTFQLPTCSNTSKHAFLTRSFTMVYLILCRLRTRFRRTNKIVWSKCRWPIKLLL